MENVVFSKVISLIKENYLITLVIVYFMSVVSSILIISQLRDSKTKIEIKSDNQISEEPSDEKNKSIYVEIAGAVNSPGVYELNNGDRLVHLLEFAQGFSEQASEEWISKALNLSGVLSDSQKIYIPFKWDPYEEGSKLEPLPLVKEIMLAQDNETATAGSNYSGSTSPGAPSDSGVVSGSGSKTSNSSGQASAINVNTASQEELDTLPGIGPAYAEKIINNRPYKNFDELAQNSTISSGTLEKIKELITY